MSPPLKPLQFPRDLLDWAGHHKGGVRRLFDDSSGRPVKVVVGTSLLRRLESWAGEIVLPARDVPRAIFLVGGPGNGKTEAVEAAIKAIDKAAGLEGALDRGFTAGFTPVGGGRVRRKVVLDLMAQQGRKLAVVPDASGGTSGGAENARAFLEDLQELIDDQGLVYLCCVNRGILDDAMILATDIGAAHLRDLLQGIVKAASLGHDAPSCWPLDGNSWIGTWPMDSESLLVPYAADRDLPAQEIFQFALSQEHWPANGACAAGALCPFCRSRQLLAQDGRLPTLLKILRWYELGTGKRWTFRDLFSLVSKVLTGGRSGGAGDNRGPCGWAAEMLALDEGRTAPGAKAKNYSAIFFLSAAQYEHALFWRWPRSAAKLVHEALKELRLKPNEVATFKGLEAFLNAHEDASSPASMGPLLSSLVDVLDPALASPEVAFAAGGASTRFGEVDSRFSLSVSHGLDYARERGLVSSLDNMLLQRLAEAETALSDPDVRRTHYATASRLQRLVRDFSCRLIRRSAGAQLGVVKHGEVLEEFRCLIEGDGGDELLDNIAEQLQALMNSEGSFKVSLNTTFGQPVPPEGRRATLVVDKQRVRPIFLEAEGRPKAPVIFLEIGPKGAARPIPLTFDLFKSIKDLRMGMSPATLPRAVVAMLDAARAKLAGPIVTSRDALEDSTILLGRSKESIAIRRGKFSPRARS
jgi:hypothetical protein